jgi:hypothetical protein
MEPDVESGLFKYLGVLPARRDACDQANTRLRLGLSEGWPKQAYCQTQDRPHGASQLGTGPGRGPFLDFPLLGKSHSVHCIHRRWR